MREDTGGSLGGLSSWEMEGPAPEVVCTKRVRRGQHAGHALGRQSFLTLKFLFRPRVFSLIGWGWAFIYVANRLILIDLNPCPGLALHKKMAKTQSTNSYARGVACRPRAYLLAGRWFGVAGSVPTWATKCT